MSKQSKIAKMARRLRIAHGLEPPPKQRKRKEKPGFPVGSTRSIFDNAPLTDEDDEDE